MYQLELPELLTSLELFELQHLIYPRLLTGVWLAGLLHKLKSYGISGISFLSNRQLQLVLNGKCPQEYAVNAGVPQDSFLGLAVFLLYINDLPGDVICDIAIYADDITRCSKCDQVSEWQQLGARSGMLNSMLGILR